MENNTKNIPLFSQETSDKLLEQQIWENSLKVKQFDQMMSLLREIRLLTKENKQSQEILLRHFFTNSNSPIPPKRNKSFLVKPLKAIISFIKRV